MSIRSIQKSIKMTQLNNIIILPVALFRSIVIFYKGFQSINLTEIISKVGHKELTPTLT
ncbi:MAG: hypothetical protein ACM3VV_04595 [Deltaproteobacteria bacterium]